MATTKKNGYSSTGKDFPEKLFAHASVLSMGGKNMFTVQNIQSYNVDAFYSEQFHTQQAVQLLLKAGFTIHSISATSISISGDVKTYENSFNTTLHTEELATIKELGKEDTATYIRSSNSEIPGLISVANSAFKNVLDGVSINEPVYFMSPNPFAPKKSFWHLQMPGDVSLGLQADPVHRQNITGKNIKVTMVDTGWYKHPYFTARGYRSNPVILGPGTANPTKDENGHGTGESANIFAIAPDVNFTMVKMSFVDSVGAFNAAVNTAPQIITCSWGSSKQHGPLSAHDLVMSSAIANAVASGITVIFSAGNGHWGFPGQHPEVISAGGVYLNNNMQLQASDYASGFLSNIYPNRKVPDVSGLVGMKPKAAYIMLPVEPNDQIDIALSGSLFPNGDETTHLDGWAAFSGTSAAAPQIAGVCALLKEYKPHLTPIQIRKILQQSAVDVKNGHCSTSTGGNPATIGPDIATGHGLVNAKAAIHLARFY